MARLSHLGLPGIMRIRRPITNLLQPERLRRQDAACPPFPGKSLKTEEKQCLLTSRHRDFYYLARDFAQLNRALNCPERVSGRSKRVSN